MRKYLVFTTDLFYKNLSYSGSSISAEQGSYSFFKRNYIKPQKHKAKTDTNH